MNILLIAAIIVAVVGLPMAGFALYAQIMRSLGYNPDGSRRGDVT